MIAIVDYGMGNLRSVQKAFENVGYEARLTDVPDEIVRAKGVVLPGVGAFDDAMRNLRERGLLNTIYEVIEKGTPYLGICLGLQLLFKESEETFGASGEVSRGLGLIEGRVRRLPGPLKVPQIGWNTVNFVREEPLFRSIESGSYFYFVHSYFVDPSDGEVVVATTDYSTRFVSAVRKGNIFATQFHPEKSGRVGLRILRNFGEMVSNPRV